MPPLRPLPRNLTARVNQNLKSCKNLGLILDKYQPWQRSTERSTDWSLQFHYQVCRHGDWQSKTSKKINESKGHWLACSPAPENIRRTDPILDPNNEQILDPNNRIDPSLYQMYLERWTETVNACSGSIFEMRSVSRLIIGLGAKGSLEMGVTLHHHAGYPWIHGNAIKGLARAAALNYLAERLGIPAVSNDEFLSRKTNKDLTPLQILEAMVELPINPNSNDPEWFKPLENLLVKLQKDPLVIARDGKILKTNAQRLYAYPPFTRVRDIFGNQGKAGEVVFYGGMCKQKPRIVTEVMTPHFIDYYQKNGWPVDSDSPVPNVYLALDAGQIYYFAIGARNSATPPRLVDDAEDFLKLGLINYGLGGKTSSGMGLFQTTSSVN